MRHFSRARERCLSLIALAALSGGTATAAVVPADDALSAAVNRTLNLRSSTLVSLPVVATPGRPLTLTVPIDGVNHTLDLAPHSVRADGYRLIVQGADGALVDAEPGPVRTMRGTVLEIPGSVVAATRRDGGLAAAIDLPGGARYWVEPAPGAADATLHVVYRQEDVIESGATCGVEQHLDAGKAFTPQPAGDGGVAGGVCVAELGCDADFEYFQDYGSVSAVEARINNVINTVNLEYESQVGLTHTVTAIIVRTAEPDPYSGADSDNLVAQVRSEWLTNQAGVPHDVAHLFTGRTIQTPFPGIIGQAYTIGGICTDQAYCYSMSDCCGSFACATDLTAHELGHLWGAFHCSCPGNTMNPSITCTNVFSAGTVSSIIAHRDSRTCLDGTCGGGGGGPDNDDCADAEPVGNGVTAFTNVGAVTDGPDEPGACAFFGYTHVDSDVWFLYTATCTGDVTVSLCGSGYDTKLAVYGASCPTGSGQVIACNDDSCDLQSEVTFAAVGGQSYRIRVGGYQGAAGSGTMTISCDGVVVPTGACCLDGGACADGVTAGACAAQGGTHQGDGTTCGGVNCDPGGGCGDPQSGDCDVANGTPFCNDAACCATVCAADAFCCNTEWDQVCADAAADLCVAGVPNDLCADAIAIGEGVTAFDTSLAGTDGPDEAANCSFFGYTQVGADIWYAYTPSCTGTATVSLCGSGYDTKLAVYGDCPTGSGQTLACNDDACDLQSDVTLAVTVGETYVVRIGGYEAATGAGTLTISCAGAPPCPGDTNGDGGVNVDDLNNVILDWGTDGSANGGDVTGPLPGSTPDGTVDVNDLNAVIVNWGACVSP